MFSTTRFNLLSYTKSYRVYFLLICLVCIVGSGVRLVNIGYKSLDLDEAVIYQISQNSFLSLIKTNASSNSAPPLYPLLVGAVSNLADSESALRMVSVIGGALAIPAAFLFGMRFLNPFGAFVLSFLTAFSFLPFFYAQYLREYSITLLLSFLIQYGFTQFIADPNRKNSWLLIVLSVIAIFTQYGLSLLIIGLNIIFASLILLGEINRATFFKWLPVQLVNVGAAACVFFISFQKQMRPGGFGVQYLSKGYWNGQMETIWPFLLDNTREMLRFFLPNHDLLLTLGLLLVGILWIAFYTKKRLVLGLSFVSFLLVFILGLLRLYPFIAGRQNIFLLPGFFLLIAAAFDAIWLAAAKVRGKLFSWGCRLVIIVGLILYIWPSIQDIQWSIHQPSSEQVSWAIDFLNEHRQPEDRIYTYYAASPAANYYLRATLPKPRLINGVYGRDNAQKYFAQLDQILRKPGTVWMVFSHCYQTECQDIVKHAGDKFTTQEVYNRFGAQIFRVR